MSKKKNEMIIHLVLPIEDSDIIRWKEALPPRTFNMYVNRILIAEARGKVFSIPCILSSSENVTAVNGRIVITNPDAIAFIRKIKRGEVTKQIKSIIRKHIECNKQYTKKADRVPKGHLLNIFNDFKTKTADKEKECIGVPDKYRKLCDFYELAFKNLFEQISQCLNQEYNTITRSKLLHIDTDKIVNDTFAFVFGDTKNN